MTDPCDPLCKKLCNKACNMAEASPRRYSCSTCTALKSAALHALDLWPPRDLVQCCSVLSVAQFFHHVSLSDPHGLSRPASGVLNKVPSKMKYDNRERVMKAWQKIIKVQTCQKKENQLTRTRHRTPIEYRCLQVGRSQFSLESKWILCPKPDRTLVWMAAEPRSHLRQHNRNV